MVGRGRFGRVRWGGGHHSLALPGALPGARARPRRSLLRTAAGLVAAVVLQLSLGSSVGRAAWSEPCDGVDFGYYYAGMSEDHANVRGAQTKIEFFNQGLCTPNDGYGSFSSNWVAIVGYDPLDVLRFNIYQVGIDKCQDPGCPRDPPTPYYFYAYGRMASTTCGQSLAPFPWRAPKGDANTTTYAYRIEKEFPSGEPAAYVLRIGGVEQNRRLTWDIETCWKGVDGAQYANEVFDLGDQSGGTVSNHQSFAENRWKDSAGWHGMNRPYLDPCDTAPGQNDWQRCFVSSTRHDTFYSWDTRAP